jgi:RNA polymerase sigma factor (sigma-70 family)
MSNYEMDDRFKNLKDSEIWSLFLSGSDSAFDYVYTKYFDKLYNYGCQFTPDHLLVEDAIQELFIDLKRRLSNLSPTDNILPYLYTAFRRKIIRLRDKSRKNLEFDLSKNFLFTFSIEDKIIDQESIDENLEKLKKGLEGLSEKDREIIYHFYFENLSYNQIQEILGFDNIKSVRNLLYKAIKALRRSIIIIFLIGSTFFKLLKSDHISTC